MLQSKPVGVGDARRQGRASVTGTPRREYDSLGRDGRTEAVGVRNVRKTGDGGWGKNKARRVSRVSRMMVVEAGMGTDT
ncbi:hypothetical protein BDV93DRAFT_315606 [Ceratobasidium sp. AG-I]|nr:hypothetical protein BDV93DRAFT_315606 [Ceratobasidium sp. AG-I]